MSDACQLFAIVRGPSGEDLLEQRVSCSFKSDDGSPSFCRYNRFAETVIMRAASTLDQLHGLELGYLAAYGSVIAASKL